MGLFRSWYDLPYIIARKEPDSPWTHVITDEATFRRMSSKRMYTLPSASVAFIDPQRKEVWYTYNGDKHTFIYNMGHEMIHRVFPEIREDKNSVFEDLDIVLKGHANEFRDPMFTHSSRELEILDEYKALWKEEAKK